MTSIESLVSYVSLDADERSWVTREATEDQ